jgi:transposase
MTSAADLAHLDADQLRVLATRLMAEMRAKQTLIDKLTHEMAVLKRIRFAATSEAYTSEQQRLLFETIETDLEALQTEIDKVAPEIANTREQQQPKRAALPANLPRTQIVHEPESTTCRCGCQLQRIGEDVAEKLDYQPGVFTVERHVRGKWVCRQCETLVQAPVAPHIIDKGIPTAGLLPHVLVAKYADHQPLYRQSGVSWRPGILCYAASFISQAAEALLSGPSSDAYASFACAVASFPASSGSCAPCTYPSSPCWTSWPLTSSP